MFIISNFISQSFSSVQTFHPYPRADVKTECYKCGKPTKHGESLCSNCQNSRLGILGSIEKHYDSNRPTFDQFKKKFLDPDQVKGLFWADDALLEYEYYRTDLHETGKAHFTPLLEGPQGFGEYKEEHVKLEGWFIDGFFSILQQRLTASESHNVLDPDSLKGIRQHFFTFRRSLDKIHHQVSNHHYYKTLPDISPIRLLLKKLIVKNGKDPGAVDNIGKVFDPGSALFFLELYVTLQDSDLLLALQDDLLNIPPNEVEHFIGSPRVIVLPWEHQQAAFTAWSQSGRRGIVEMATATGKTLVGLMAIEDMAKSNDDATIRVLSTSRAILNQWKRESVQKLGLLQNVYRDFNTPVTWKGITVHFQTIQSIMDHPEYYPADLLIVDEVHHFASPEFRKAFQIPAPEKMGLSATVDGDVKLSILKEELGPVVYKFELKDALVKGIIPSFEWKVIPVYLAVAEADEFKKISQDITYRFSSVKGDTETISRITGGKRKRIEDLGEFIRLIEQARYKKMELPAEWKQIQALILKRRWIIHKSQPRLEHAMELAQDLAKTKKVILFTMDTDSCDYLGKELEKDNKNIFVIHSFIKGDPNILIERFKRAPYGALIGAQMLGEGIDIPDAEIGINVAASKTRLQLTQRMGRILRKGTGNKKAPVFYHYVAIPEPESYIPEEDDVAFLDDLAWVQDAALRMGLDAEVIGNEELLKQELAVENSFSTRFFDKDLTKKVPKFGTFNLKYVMSQLTDRSIFRIITILQNLEAVKEISNPQWARIIRSSCGKKRRDEKNWEHLDIPGYWWLLILGKRNPSRIIEIFKSVRADLDHSADETDEEIIREVSEELNNSDISAVGPEVIDDNVLAGIEQEPVATQIVISPEIVAADAVPVLQPEIVEPVQGSVNEQKSEKVVSTFRIGNLSVSEIEIDHDIDELLEEPPPKEFEGKDLTQLTLEDLFEPEA